MARIRSIKPDFCSSESIAALTIPCRLHFALLWTYCFDDGIGVDNPKLIKAALWPLDDEITVETVEGWQQELERNGRIVRYESEGKALFCVANFTEHQKPNRRVPSKLELPTQEQCTASALRWQCGASAVVVDGGVATQASVVVPLHSVDNEELPMRGNADAARAVRSLALHRNEVEPRPKGGNGKGNHG